MTADGKPTANCVLPTGPRQPWRKSTYYRQCPRASSTLACSILFLRVYAARSGMTVVTMFWFYESCSMDGCTSSLPAAVDIAYADSCLVTHTAAWRLPIQNPPRPGPFGFVYNTETHSPAACWSLGDAMMCLQGCDHLAANGCRVNDTTALLDGLYEGVLAYARPSREGLDAPCTNRLRIDHQPCLGA